ncbi:hypothetical protein KG892_02595 [Vermiphilus pyriformis]|nr:MAG: hypothetical protein KG892_02595 [Vermiphilus pyriformis]
MASHTYSFKKIKRILFLIISSIALTTINTYSSELEYEHYRLKVRGGTLDIPNNVSIANAITYIEDCSQSLPSIHQINYTGCTSTENMAQLIKTIAAHNNVAVSIMDKRLIIRESRYNKAIEKIKTYLACRPTAIQISHTQWSPEQIQQCIAELPEDIQNNIKSINLSHNEFTYAQSCHLIQAFIAPESPLKQLYEVNFSHNNITKIDHEILDNIPNNFKVNFSHNPITSCDLEGALLYGPCIGSTLIVPDNISSEIIQSLYERFNYSPHQRYKNIRRTQHIYDYIKRNTAAIACCIALTAQTIVVKYFADISTKIIHSITTTIHTDKSSQAITGLSMTGITALITAYIFYKTHARVKQIFLNLIHQAIQPATMIKLAPC